MAWARVKETPAAAGIRSFTSQRPPARGAAPLLRAAATHGGGGPLRGPGARINPPPDTGIRTGLRRHPNGAVETIGSRDNDRATDALPIAT